MIKIFQCEICNEAKEEKERERGTEIYAERDRDTEKKTERNTETQIHTHAHIHMHIEIQCLTYKWKFLHNLNTLEWVIYMTQTEGILIWDDLFHNY